MKKLIQSALISSCVVLGAFGTCYFPDVLQVCAGFTTTAQPPNCESETCIQAHGYSACGQCSEDFCGYPLCEIYMFDMNCSIQPFLPSATGNGCSPIKVGNAIPSWDPAQCQDVALDGDQGDCRAG